jgi:hypothetical protein
VVTGEEQEGKIGSSFSNTHTHTHTHTHTQTGGHGYSKYNGLSGTLQDFAVMCTWEGDNTVMALQTARYLVRCYEKAVEGKEKLAGMFIRTHTHTRAQIVTVVHL